MVIWEKTFMVAISTTPENAILMIAAPLFGIYIWQNYNPAEQQTEPEQPKHTQEIDNAILKNVINSLSTGQLTLKAQSTEQDGHIQILGKDYMLTITKPPKPVQTTQPPEHPPKKDEPVQTGQPDQPQKGIQEVMAHLTRGDTE